MRGTTRQPKPNDRLVLDFRSFITGRRLRTQQVRQRKSGDTQTSNTKKVTTSRAGTILAAGIANKCQHRSVLFVLCGRPNGLLSYGYISVNIDAFKVAKLKKQLKRDANDRHSWR
jgi:predicted polyphosphate/ATP-dependent NAD kinase